jgi:hypothetical protein
MHGAALAEDYQRIYRAHAAAKGRRRGRRQAAKEPKRIAAVTTKSAVSGVAIN